MASPRGFCAGVKRAIEIVELAIQEHGSPIYVRHEIVHNKRVVEDLKKKGAIFVEELDELYPLTEDKTPHSTYQYGKFRMATLGIGQNLTTKNIDNPLVTKGKNSKKKFHLISTSPKMLSILLLF